MSLIIAYIGKKGCVIAADKRRIAFFGEKENRELLEADMYSGDITTDTLNVNGLNAPTERQRLAE